MTPTAGQGPFYVGIDLGGTNIKTGVVNGVGHVLSHVRVPTRATDGSAAGVERMAATAERAIAEAGITKE
jgi:glucokinase